MARYTIEFARRVDGMLLQHVEFLSRVSVPAARQFRQEFAALLKRMEENPLQFPLDTDMNLPEGVYRRALFFGRYKVIFSVSETILWLDAVVDCRQDPSSGID